VGGGTGVASLSLGASAYGFGGIEACCELDVACRSLLGGALTVRRSLLLEMRSTEAEEEEEACCGVLLRVLALLYGCADSRAAVEDALRAERRVGGMMLAV